MNGPTLAEARVLDAALFEYIETHHGDVLSDVPLEDIDLAVGLRKQVADFVDAVFDHETTLQLWTDGAARPTNPGPAGIGVIGKIGGRTVIEVSEHIGRATNNVAEYKAAVTALRRAVDFGVRRVLLHTDSQLVYRQYRGDWQCREASLVPLLYRLRGLAQRFESFEIKWIPREQNREADGLSVAGAHPPPQEREELIYRRSE